MTVLRRFAFALVLLLSTLLPGWAAAQDDYESVIPPESVEAAVSRQFNKPSLALDGPLSVRTFVFVYDDQNVASMALPLAVEELRDTMAGPDGGDMRVASTPDVGDEQLAFAGSVDAGETDAQAAIFGWREGHRVYVLVGVGLAGDMFTPLFDLADDLSGKPLPETEATRATLPTEMSSGGAYELLPSLDDMPPGWVFADDNDLIAAGSATPTP